MSFEDHVLNRAAALVVLAFLPIIIPCLAIISAFDPDRTVRQSLIDSAVILFEMLFMLLTGRLCEIVTEDD